MSPPPTQPENLPLPTNAWSTRWRLKLLWYRSCYTFLWAHHPLCVTFRKDVLRIGPIHLCRSCVCVYLGLILTTIACVTFFSFFRQHAPVILTSVLLPTLLFSYPKLYKKLPRFFRDLARLAMGTLFPLTIVLLWTALWPLTFAISVLLYLFWRYYFRLRQRRRATACASCPEYGQNLHCSGTLHQTTCLRAYEESATNLLYTP